MARETVEQQAERLWQYVVEFLKEEARPPSQRQMMAACHVSSARLRKLLRLLDKQGRTAYRPLQHRQVWPKVEGGLRNVVRYTPRMDD